MDDPLTKEEKSKNFQRLVDTQNRISGEKHAEYVGKEFRVLIDGEGTDPRHNLTSRTAGGRLVYLSGDPALVGTWAQVKIVDANTWALYGELVEK
jgi:tRNA-2-methylthio-N6-dimethylallyladenosine synthase